MRSLDTAVAAGRGCAVTKWLDARTAIAAPTVRQQITATDVRQSFDKCTLRPRHSDAPNDVLDHVSFYRTFAAPSRTHGRSDVDRHRLVLPRSTAGVCRRTAGMGGAARSSRVRGGAARC